MAYPGTKQTMMKYFAAQLVEYYEEIANAAEAPEPLPEHRTAVLALEAGQRATMRPMPTCKGNER